MNPIIDSAVASPAVFPPGGAFVISAVAHDPDDKAGVGIVEVSDAAGNKSSVNVDLRVSDLITFTLTLPPGYTQTPRPGQPGVWDCVAPA